ncbi:hypothetical protein AAFF39_00550 [Lactococcus garvieae]
MSEQKYYVGLKSLIDANAISHFLWKDHRFYPGFEKPSYSFTMDQISKISGGYLLNNPLIELMPVEVEE